MSRLRRKTNIVLALVLAAVIAGVTFAATSATGTVSISAGGPGGGAVASVVKASDSTQFLVYGDYKDGDPKYNDPFWTFERGKGAHIFPGDLFYIDTSGVTQHDVRITLYITNADELSSKYRYLNMMINAYKLVEVSGEAVATGDGSTKNFWLDHSPLVPESETIYVNGAPQTRDVDYTIKNHNGRVHFNTAPANGTAITADYQYWTQALQADGSPITQEGARSTVTAEAVGTGDGHEKVFFLDNRHVVASTEGIYVDGVLQSRGKHADYVLNNTNGKIRFTSAPASSAVITADYQYWDDWRAVDDVYLTMQNGSIMITLAGNAKYAITVDKGNLRTMPGGGSGGSITPQFYIETRAA